MDGYVSHVLGSGQRAAGTGRSYVCLLDGGDFCVSSWISRASRSCGAGMRCFEVSGELFRALVIERWDVSCFQK